MNADELRRTHEEYRHAIEVARDEAASDEARKTAGDQLIELRHTIDTALIDDKLSREDEARLESIEARMSVARKLSDIVVHQPGIPVADIRAYAQTRDHGKSMTFTVPAREARSVTDMTTTDTSSYASRTVPQTWYDRVVMFQLAMSGVLQAGPTILATANGNQINVPTLTTDMTATAGSEGAAASNSTYPVFGTVPLNSYRVEGFVALSDELLRDSGVDLETVLADLAGRALGAKAAAYYGDIDIGTGSSLPAAITVGVTSALTAASQTAVTFDELRQLYYAVLPQYRAMGKWVANSAVTLAAALAKTGTGEYLWEPSNQVGQPDMFMGKPWYEDAYFDASASGNIPVVFGDVGAAYWVRRIGGIEVSFSRDFAFSSFETTMRFALWHDAATVDAIAVKGITLA